MKVFEEKELIKMENKFIEKEWAFPDLEGDQTAALMLEWDGKKWSVSCWNAAIDGAGKEVLGWEPLIITNKQTAIDFVNKLMKSIENGE